jgi:hypothetical protein
MKKEVEPLRTNRKEVEGLAHSQPLERERERGRKKGERIPLEEAFVLLLA